MKQASTAFQPQGLRNLRAYQRAKQLWHLIRSLKKKRHDGSWDRTYQTTKEDPVDYEIQLPPHPFEDDLTNPPSNSGVPSDA